MSESEVPLSPPISQFERPIEVFVIRPSRPKYWLHLLLLAATFFTTTLVGARLQYNFNHNLPAFSTADDTLPLFPLHWVLQQPALLLKGLPFSLTLMLILLAHEMGHYIYARRYGISATLPFFIPAPTLIGTLGAFIRIKSRIRSRAALFDIGIAGPIAGFIFAVPIMFLGLLLSKSAAGRPQSDFQIGFPLIFAVGHELLRGVSPTLHTTPLSQLHLHPVAVAAWVGMFATALNLLPGGQLDGGHIIYAIAPRAHRKASALAVAVLLPFAFFYWIGWVIWAVLLAMTGLRHPDVPREPGLGPGRRLLAWCALLMLLLTLVPAPFSDSSFLSLLQEMGVHLPFLR